MKKLIAIVALAAAPVLFAQEKKAEVPAKQLEKQKVEQQVEADKKAEIQKKAEQMEARKKAEVQKKTEATAVKRGKAEMKSEARSLRDQATAEKTK